jgi:thioredoxin 1
MSGKQHGGEHIATRRRQGHWLEPRRTVTVHPVGDIQAMSEPSRDEVDAMQGPTMLEFGSSWCGICRAAQPLIRAALLQHPGVRHVKVEDGPGRPLGRSFRVKLWPTLVFLRDGRETARLARPRDRHAIDDALARIAASPRDAATDAPPARGA